MEEISLADSARKMICEIETAMLLRSPRRQFTALLFEVRVPVDTNPVDVFYSVSFARGVDSWTLSAPEWGLWCVRESSDEGSRSINSIGRLCQAPLEVQLAFLRVATGFVERWLELLEDQPDPSSLDRGRAALGLLAKTTYLDKDLVLRNGDGTPSELTP